MTYEEVLQWIHSIGRFGIRPGLERMNALMERLGNPHHQFKCIHIAGTNGKGSTAVFITSVLQSAGYRVGLYTSPYLETFNNRISLG
ncbi:MAG: bifunctional folylpolyglutamate synthase/dihydrofolate synthase, partial [Firmicutes bacterium]|nr:bifunctional folylpolyglutamate synthase/dihydrofolate synthase [Bacillota bacterium]